jgi:hypothetical protein
MPNKMPNKRLENALNAGKLIKLGNLFETKKV